MVRFAFNLNESSMSKIKELEEQGYSYHLSALFAPMSIEKDEEDKYKKFEYENEILDFLQSIDGAKNDRNVLSFLDNKRIKEGKLCRHMVMVMPYCASCDAMEKLINDNKDALKNLSDYEIINISGLNSQYTKIQEVKSKIATCESEDKKTITLTVNRMLTGCTVPQWDTMIFLKDTASPQDYDQAIFRLQSQYVVEYEGKEIVDGQEVKKVIKKDMKPQTLLVDFNPQRMFYLQETKSRINNINTADGGNDESEERIKRDLEVSPIIHISENKLVEVTPTDILKAVSEYSTNRGITEAANDIIVDENLINFDNVKNVIDKEFEIGSGKGFAEQAYSGDETDLDEDDIHTNGETDETHNDNHETKQDTNTGKSQEKETDIKVFVKKCRSYYRRILFYAFLSKGEKEIKNLNAVIESLSNSENERIFNNLGMNKDFVGFLKSNMSGAALRSLDNKIYDLYRLSHEYENSDDDPIKRATTAIQRFGKISDSEVVTPQRIAKEMIDLIPEEDFKKVFENGNKFLDVASKMGEFAVAIYRRAESLGIPKESIKNSIYSIPTSSIAYEFTRFVYEKLDLNEENLAERFNSYELLDFADENEKADYKSVIKFLKQNKPFKSIKPHKEISGGDEVVNFDVIVGNPPYQENIGSQSNRSLSKQLFPTMMQLAITINPKYLTMITPSRWFTGNAQDRSFVKLREFVREHNHFRKITNFLNSSEVFDGVSVPGGVNYFLYEPNYSGTITFKEIQQKTETCVERPLFEDGLEVILPMNRMISILQKVRASDFVSMEEIVTGRNPFGIPANDADLNKEMVEAQDESHEISILCAYEKIQFVSRELITRNSSLCDHWKVFTSKMNGGAGTLLDGKQVAILGRTFVMGPGSICSNTLLAVGDFDNQTEAENLNKYMNTKFFRFMLGIKKIAQVLTSNIYSFVPQQNFKNNSDITWANGLSDIDKQLYAKYGLEEDEITFIESMIKPME